MPDNSVSLNETTIDGAAKKLREMAELTSAHSKNWDNFEQIVVSLMNQAYDAGYTSGTKLL